MADKKTGAAEHPKVAAVRKAADAFADALADARAAGFAVQFPSHVGGLRSIAISETGKAGTEVGDDLAGAQVETKTVET